MKISLYNITSLMIQLSITFPHHKKFPPSLIKKVFFQTLHSWEEYRSSCTGVFYENKCSEKCPENSHIQCRREDFFVEPEAEREATGFSLWIIWKFWEQIGFDKVTFKRATFPLSCPRKNKKAGTLLFAEF